MRTHGSRQQQNAVKTVPAKQMQKVYEVSWNPLHYVLSFYYLHMDRGSAVE